MVAGIEGCEGKVIKFLFWDGNFLAHILIVEANFLVAESEMTEFIKPSDEPYREWIWYRILDNLHLLVSQLVYYRVYNEGGEVESL